jgi:ABC-type dipeptide/oligopeptide/nickel transport system permease subunit
MRRSGALWVGGVLSGLVLVACLAGAFMNPASATDVHGTDEDAGSYVPSSADHWLGLDRNGRDLGARLVGATTAFAGPGLLAALAGVLLGVAAGAVAGYFTGWLSRLLNVILSAVDAIPRLALLLLIALAFGGRMTAVALGLACSFTPTIASEVAARVRAFRSEDFIDAARAHGLGTARILLYHVLWLNSRNLLMKWAAFLFGATILAETSLSYLGTIEGSVGIGVAEPAPSWGNMLARAKDTLLDPTWPALLPIAATVLSIFGFLLLAEGLATLDMRRAGRKEED